jgi:glycosyltransferase involved in cell wall biosynthesis
MKILFVVDQLPFPPRNGVTIPTANYINGLKKNNEIDVLFLKEGNINKEFRNNTLNKINNLITIETRKNEFILSIIEEILLVKPIFANKKYINKHKLVLDKEYDVVLASPISTLYFTLNEIKNRNIKTNKIVAGVSDIYTAVLRNKYKNMLDFKSLFKKSISYIRSYFMKYHERKILSKVDHILVQSRIEINWAKKIGGDSLENKCTLLSNGVNNNLFNLPLKENRKILFLGNLEGQYKNTIEWFLKDVWSEINKKYPQGSLTLIGKGANSDLKKLMEDKNVSYKSYVKKLLDVYYSYSIFVAPIFKGYGLINKVVEAMAAGCIVIGDETAFNGIENFKNNEHGIIANNRKEFIKEISKAIENPDKYNDIKINARKLIRENFAWENRIEKLQEILVL